MPEARVLAILFILISCGLLTIGRSLVRRQRRAKNPRFPSKAFAWTLLAAGCIFMILGVLLW